MTAVYMYNEQLLLRAMEPADAEVMYRVENDPTLWGVSNTQAPYSLHQLRQYVARTHSDIYAERQLRLVVALRECGDVAGLVDLTRFEPLHGRAEVGIVLLPLYRGRGLARQAVRLVADYAFGHLHLHQLYACVPSFNERSLRLFQACGFASCGTLRQWVRTADGYADACLFQLFAGGEASR